MGIARRRRRCTSWGCWRRLGRFSLFQVYDSGGKITFFCEDCQTKRGQHEDRCNDDGELAQEVSWAAATEYCLARSAECRADFCPLARLQQDRANHEETNEHVNDDKQGIHAPFRSINNLSYAQRGRFYQTSPDRDKPLQRAHHRCLRLPRASRCSGASRSLRRGVASSKPPLVPPCRDEIANR